MLPEMEIHTALDRLAPIPESLPLMFQSGLILLAAAAFALTFARRGWTSALPGLALAAAAAGLLGATVLHPAARDRSALAAALCTKAAASIAAEPSPGRAEAFERAGCSAALLAPAAAEMAATVHTPPKIAAAPLRQTIGGDAASVLADR